MSPAKTHVPILVGAILVAGSVVGAFSIARRLDLQQSTRTLRDLTPSRWTAEATPTPRASLSLGRFVVPASGGLRVRICPTAPTDPRATLEVTTVGRSRREAVPLAPEEGRARPCFEALWRPRGGASARADARLTVQGRGPAPALREATVSSGGLIRPWMGWPALALLAGLGLMVFAPRRKHHADPEASLDPPPERPPPSPWLAVSVLAAVNVAVIFSAGALTRALGEGGVAFLAAFLLQHGLTALAAVLLLGAPLSREPRATLGLVPVSAVAIRKALWAATGLVAAAVLTSLALEHAGDTPMGQYLSSVPARYAVAFGALVAPLSEELFFRGVLVPSFGRTLKEAGVITSAVVFTALHAVQLEGAWLALLPIGLLGLTNGYLKVTTNSLTVPWLVHLIYNGVLASTILFVP